jgi:Leucine-rich repeat (LRR) protein
MHVDDPKKLESIKALDLSETYIEEEEIVGLELLKHLEFLDISSCDIDGSLKLLGRSVPHLKKLDLSRCYIVDALFSSMIRKLENLEELDICYNINLTNRSLEVIARKCKKLKVIKVIINIIFRNANLLIRLLAVTSPKKVSKDSEKLSLN